MKKIMLSLATAMALTCGMNAQASDTAVHAGKVEMDTDFYADDFEIVHVTLPESEGRTHPGFDMVLVASGRFEMGSNKGDKDEKPVHYVIISDDFFIGETEVTQSLWTYVMGTNPSTIKGDDLPVENISWEEAIEFCDKLSELTGSKFRLPTEAEWEYAAHGGQQGTTTLYSGSDYADEVCWNETNIGTGKQPKPVKSKMPNELGIYDMSGNVYEYCFDSKDDYPKQSVTDPVVDNGHNTDRVRRGGAWNQSATNTRVTFRRRVAYDKDTDTHPGSADTGLRIVMEVAE